MLENFTYQMRRVSQLYDQKVAMIESDLNPDDEKAKSIHILNLSNKRLIEDNPLQSTQRENHDINNPVDQKYDFDDLMGWNNTYVFEIMMPFI